MKRTYQLLSLGFSLLMFFLVMTGCTTDQNVNPQDSVLSDRGFTTIANGTNISFYALSDRNELLRYKAGPPAQMVSLVPLTGLDSAEHMLAIDFRPANGFLYGVSDYSQLYIIDPGSGQTKNISRGPFEPVIKGSAVGFDFDPVADRIRLVTNENQNLRLDPDMGIVSNVDLDLSPASMINSIAYQRAYTPSRLFPLYDIDAATGELLKQDPQNDGTLTHVGSLGLVISGEGGFDIGANNNSHTIFSNQNADKGYAVLFGHALAGGVNTNDDLATDASRVWEISLTTGKATYKGKFDRNIIGIAIP